MSEQAAKLLEAVLVLPEADRVRLAGELWDSVTGDAELTAGALDDPAVQAELDRRLVAVADGTAELIDGDEAFGQIRARLRAGRP